MARPEIQSEMRQGPLFVVGMWRSGTSLLYALLNQHPRIGMMYESDMLLLKPVFLWRNKSPWWLEKIDFWNQALTRHKIDREAIDPNITGLAPAFSAVAQQYARKKGASVWGCKSPNYYDRLIKLANWFPSARFIVIWRDPAEVLKSVARAAETNSWFARPGMELRALLGYRRMIEDAAELERRRAAVFQLRYEDLIQNPGGTMQAISDFLGLEFDPRTVSLEGADRSAIYEGEHHAKVKSASIQSAGDGSQALPLKLRNKLDRYLVHWRKQSCDSWPIRIRIGENTRAASFLERTADQMRYRMLRAADRTVPFAYAMIPTSLWEKYRRRKARRQPLPPKRATGSRLADLSQ
jgi:Sulfotransferase family